MWTCLLVECLGKQVTDYREHLAQAVFHKRSTSLHSHQQRKVLFFPIFFNTEYSVGFICLIKHNLVDMIPCVLPNVSKLPFSNEQGLEVLLGMLIFIS